MLKKRLSSKFHYLQWLWQTRKLRKNFPNYCILNLEKTIDKIITEKLSISRFGDGEFRLCLPEYTLEFQEQNEYLRTRLQEVLGSSTKNHLICLPEPLFSVENFEIPIKYWWKKFINNYGERIKPFIDEKKTYGNSFITRFYIGYENKSEKRILKIVAHLKKIWEAQDILIVEGQYSRLGVGNDLFSNAKSLQRIVCPPKNAFKLYEEILESAKKHGKNKLILLALGPTATIMSYDLAKEGYWALDVGHIDIEYMWFLMKAIEKIPVKGRHVNEASEQESLEIPEEFKNQYLKSIILEIS